MNPSSARRDGVIALALLLVVAAAGLARADGGMPAVGRVRAVGPGPALVVAATTGYGYTEDVLDQDDAHHRLSGTLALAGRPLGWLELGGLLAGRYDRHAGWVADDGWIGEPRLWASGGGRVAPGTWLGARAGAWLPGNSLSSIELDAMTFELAAVLTWSRGGTAVTATGGYRIDRSAASFPEPHLLSDPDRLALGLSQFDAVLLGAGVSHRRGRWQLLGEASWDLLVGEYSPEVLASPLRIGVGVRRALGDVLQVEALVELSPGRRPGTSSGDPLVAVEPRASAVVGLSWRPRAAGPAARPRAIEAPVEAAPPRAVVPSAPTVGAVRGRVTDADGAPVVGATVRLGAREVTTDADGRFVFDRVEPGEVEVVVEAAGRPPEPRTVAVSAGGEAAVEVTLPPLPPAAEIRLLIRSFKGTGLPATVRIEPGARVLTAAADGTFSVEVAPGTYQVVVSMEGYVSQTRTFKLGEKDVDVRNIDLQKKSR